MTKLERRVLLFIDEYTRKHGFPPTRIAMIQGCHTNHGPLQNALRGLEKLGYLDPGWGKKDHHLYMRLLVDVADVCGGDSVADKAVS